MSSTYRAAVVTVSDSGSRGERIDTGGPAVARVLAEAGYDIGDPVIVPDDRAVISATLIDLIDRQGAALVVTTGGTGLAPSDVTPEATAEVIDKRVEGLEMVMRMAGLDKTPHAMLSRGLAGARGAGLIINVPGSPKGAVESLEAVLPALRHALDKLGGDPTPCAG